MQSNAPHRQPAAGAPPAYRADVRDAARKRIPPGGVGPFPTRGGPPLVGPASPRSLQQPPGLEAAFQPLPLPLQLAQAEVGLGAGEALPGASVDLAGGHAQPAPLQEERQLGGEPRALPP